VANLNPFGGEARVNTEPLAITEATYTLQSKHHLGITEIQQIPGRGHSLTIDHGWKDVADTALAFHPAVRLSCRATAVVIRWV
jgi:hypothetical protein